MYSDSLDTLQPKTIIVHYLKSIYQVFKDKRVNIVANYSEEIQSVDVLMEQMEECLAEVNHSTQEEMLYRLNICISQVKGLLFRLKYHHGDAILPLKLAIKPILQEVQKAIVGFNTPVKQITLVTTEENKHPGPPRFFAEQVILDKNDNFKLLLSQIKNEALTKKLSAKKIFLSYAWPTADIADEQWTAQFVDSLVEHLISAGLMVYQDKIHSGFGRHLDEYMQKKIAKAQHVFFILTKTYVKKFMEDGSTGISTEYFQTIDRWRDTDEKRLICPILLADVPLPAFARRFSGIPFYEMSYFDALKEILKKIYGFGENINDIWKRPVLIEPYEQISKDLDAIKTIPTRISQLPGIFNHRKDLVADPSYLGQTYSVIENNCIIELQNPIFTISLNKLESLINESTQNLTFVSIEGCPGSGKTVLAQSYLNRFKENQLKGSQYGVVTLWIFRSEKPATLYEDYQMLAKAFKLPVSDSMSVQQLKQGIEEKLKQRPNFLFIFDNIEDYESVAPYLPSRGLKGKVIITSRNMVAMQGKTFPVIHFNMLDSNLFTENEALELFRQLTGLTTDEHAKILAHTLGYLPLALAQAGSCIARCDGALGYAGYLECFKNPSETLQNESYFSPSEAYFHNYGIVINLSIDKLPSEEYQLVDFLKFISLLNPDRIPEFLLIKKIAHSLGRNEQSSLIMRSGTWIQLLQKFALVNRILGAHAITIHRVIQTVVNARYVSEIKKSLEDAMNLLIEMLDIDYRSLVNWKERAVDWDNAVSLLSHAESVLEHADKIENKDERFNRLIAKLLQLCAECYSKKSNYPMVEKKLEQALATCNALDKRNVDNLIVLADIHLSNGRYLTWVKTAYKSCIESLTIAHTYMVTLYGQNDPTRTLRAYGAIAVAHNFNNEHELAKPMFLELLNNPDLPKNDWQEAGYNHNLVEIFFALKDYRSAKSHMEKSLAIYEFHNHPQINPVLNDLGRNTLKLSDEDQAEQYFTRVLNNHQQDPAYLYVRPIYVAEAYYGLAKIALKRGAYELAQRYILEIKKLDQEYSMNIYNHLKFQELKAFEEEVVENYINIDNSNSSNKSSIKH